MKIQLTSIGFGRGVYYTKTGMSLTNELRGNAVSVSEEGFKFIENVKLDKSLKERIESTRFIQSLAKEYDTFIKYGEVGPTKAYQNRHMAFAEIVWGDRKSGFAGKKMVVGESHSMIEKAINSMIKNLNGEHFSELSLKHFT